MAAFEREIDMRLVGLQALVDELGDDSSNIYEEFRLEDISIDALVTRVDEDALQDRRAMGLDTPLIGDERGIYNWFARNFERDPDGLYQSINTPDRDRELVETLAERGYLTDNGDGSLSAVEFPRHIELVAVEFAASGWRKPSAHLHSARSVTDEQWLVIGAGDEAEARESREMFESSGFGLAALSPDGTLTRIVEAVTDGADNEARTRALAEDIYAEEVF